MKTPEEFNKPFETCPRGEDCVHCDCTIEECAAIQREQALAYIQQLEAQVPRWISVEERLPEHDVRVLFGYARYGYVGVGHLDREEMDWLDIDEIQVAQPSHWMSLPEPPKEEK